MANLRVGNIKFKSKRDKNKFLQLRNDFNNRRKSIAKKMAALIMKEVEAA